MTWHFRGAVGRWSLGVLATVCIAGAALAYAARSDSASAITTGSTAAFRRAVVARMHTENLRFLWVACVRTGNRFHSVPVVRCNVDFGEPHIVAYCSVFRNGRLLTSEDNAAIPCRRDDSGWSDPVVTYR